MKKTFSFENNAFVTFWPSSTMVGQVISISMNGLIFEYPRGSEKPKESGKLNISLPKEDLHVREVPFQVVKDWEEGDHYNTWDLWCCRVEFGPLTHRLKFDIEHLIKNFTVTG